VVLSPCDCGQIDSDRTRVDGEETLVTISNQYGTTMRAGGAGPAGHPEHDDPTRPATVSPAALMRVLAHLRHRARSHRGSPATGLYWMSTDQWRACIGELRRRGYQISESIVTHGDRAANEIGYTLTAEPPRPDPRPFAGRRSPGPASTLMGRVADRTPGPAI
jgi:hypothetical protein